MNVYEAIIADEASTPNEKMLAQKALTRAKAPYRSSVTCKDISSALQTAYYLGLSVEHSSRDDSIVLYGDRTAVKRGVALVDIWEQGNDSLAAAVSIEVFKSLPLSIRKEVGGIEPRKERTRFVRKKAGTGKKLTGQDRALVDAIAHKITRIK